MYTLFAKNIELSIDSENGVISSLKLGEIEACADACPVFALGFAICLANAFMSIQLKQKS